MSRARYDLRPATTSDIPQIVTITNAAFEVEAFIDGPRTDAAGVAGMMSRGIFLLAEESGRIVASVYIELRGSRGYFGMLSVDPVQQGRGLGRVMIEAAENHCRSRGCQAMDITVLSLRPELPPYYRKFGYAEAGTEEFHPNRPLKDRVECHCIVMSKTL